MKEESEVPADVEFELDGATVRCPDGLSVAAALFHLGRSTLGRTAADDRPRSLFCGMGVCFECAMEIDGRAGVRACATPVRDGMRVVTQVGASKLGRCV